MRPYFFLPQIAALAIFILSGNGFAQLSYKKLANHHTPLKASIRISDMPAGFSPGIVREAPAPLQSSVKPGSPAPAAFNSSSKPLAQTTVGPVPVKSFAGQGYQFSAPNDNHLAVGINAQMISVLNTNMTAYDTAGNVLTSASLADFADTLGVLGYTFDPRVIYDPEADRFVLTFLNGFLDSTSQIIIAFSQTADPAGLWNFYLLNGNPLNNSTWSDYPAIGLNNNELFLTFNTFTNGSTNNSGYTESTIWQIDKSKGYAGTALVSDYYYDIKWGADTLFNTTPVTGGSTLYGPNMYFLNSNPFSTSGTDTLYILEITNSIASGNATLQVSALPMGVPYYQPIAAGQRNNHTLITNDARVQSAILESDMLHFVLNSVDQSSQRPCVYYGRVGNFSGTRTPMAFNLTDTLDLAYGAIGHLGDLANPGAVVVGCLHSSTTTNAGHSAFYIDGTGAVSSRSLLKNGNGILNVLSGTNERWGDYTGCVSHPGEPGSVWYAGSFGSSNARNMTWITKIQIGQQNVSTNPESASANTFSIFPVPTSDRLTIEFALPEAELLEIALYDLTGKKVKTLIQDWTRAGNHSFSFSTRPLGSGTYFLRVSNSVGITLMTQKVLVD